MRKLIGGTRAARMLLLCLSAMLILGACAQDDEGATGATGDEAPSASVSQPQPTATVTATATSAATEITVTATEYAFDIPDEIPAGPATFVLENAGEESHHMGMALIHPDAPPLKKLLQMSEKESAEFIDEIGFIPPVKPGKTSKQRLTTTLEPGHYGIACFVKAPDGKPHALHGMFAEFDVVGDATAAQVEPDVTVIATEYAFDMPSTLPAGPIVLGMRNDGEEDHILVMAKLKAGAPPVEKIVKMPEREARSHLEDVGFISPTKPGETARNVIDADLTPGTYMVACFVDAPDGKHHALHGMFREVTVE